MSVSLDLEPFVKAARAGGAALKHSFGNVADLHEKTNNKDIVSAADLKSERVIIEELKRHYPDFNIYAEETGRTDNGSLYTIVIDPLDGTSNFAINLPNFSVSIGVLEGKKAVLGVVYQPLVDALYSAVDGRGAFLNGKPISVNHHKDLKNAIISYGCGYNTPPAFSEGLKQRLTQFGIKRMLDSWSLAYEFCLLASGKIEAIVSNGLDLEDYIAGKVILREAGGRITDFSGEQLSSDDTEKIFLATNHAGKLHDELLVIVQNV